MIQFHHLSQAAVKLLVIVSFFVLFIISPFSVHLTFEYQYAAVPVHFYIDELLKRPLSLILKVFSP